MYNVNGRVYPTGTTIYSSPARDQQQKVLWQPNPGPQTDAYNSQADILGYGGAGGGGKTDLLLGLAATQHYHSVIFRRVFPNLRGIIERSREIFNDENINRQKDSYNESLHRWQFNDGRMLEFEACQFDKDKEKQRGRPRDFYGFDEATEFAKLMIVFITAWLRTTRKGQRTRIVLTFNPPLNDSGAWVIDFFRPWLSHLYPDLFPYHIQAKPGELLWYSTDENGDETISRRRSKGAVSRTFIPAKLEDNPYLADTKYRDVLNSLPEPLRSQLLHGDFGAESAANPMQVIPTQWILQAIERWQDSEEPENTTAVAVDAARGGRDNMVIAKLKGDYVPEPEKIKGAEVPNGQTAAAKIIHAVGDDSPLAINIDLIGVGSSVYDFTNDLLPNVNGFNAANKSDYYDKSGQLKMRNQRAEIYWRMRDELDPANNPTLALPNIPELIADLSAANWELTASGVLIEPKEQIKERLGRSPDMGEAVLMLLYENKDRPIAGVFASSVARLKVKS